MNRLFGTSSRAKPPSLNDSLEVLRRRVDRKNVEIAQKDGEIRGIMEKIKNMSERAKVRFRVVAHFVLSLSLTYTRHTILT